MKYPTGLPLAAALALALGSVTASAADSRQGVQDVQKERQEYENAGIVYGILGGAILGGPPGAIAAAVTGGWLGDKFHDAKQGREYQARLESADRELAELRARVETLQAQNQGLAMERDRQKNLVASLQPRQLAVPSVADSEIVLHFRTKSAAIEPQYRAPLERFVHLVNSRPDAGVEIQGYADRRGGNASNLALSQQRIQAVEDALKSLGLAEVTFYTTANGEGKPVTVEDNFESNFFDRRVVLRLRSSESAMLSQNQP